jgi:hypothetical protein
MPNTDGTQDLRELLRRAIELAQPNLRKYFRMPRKGKIVTAYRSDGTYYADVQVLTNDGSPDPDEPMYPKLDLPVIWGGPARGVVCPPAAGTPCVVGYYDGDPNFPFIQDIRWQQTPEAELDEFVIQLNETTQLKIDKQGNICLCADTAGQSGGKAGKSVLIEVGTTGALVMRAPAILTYTDSVGGGSYAACPVELRASTKAQ